MYSLNDDHSDEEDEQHYGGVFGNHSNRPSQRNANRRSKDSRQIISVNMQSHEDIDDLVGAGKSTKLISIEKQSRMMSEAFVPVTVEKIGRGNVSGDKSTDS
jgi:hypothetical protein